jgi:hypothetical protein
MEATPPGAAPSTSKKPSELDKTLIMQKLESAKSLASKVPPELCCFSCWYITGVRFVTLAVPRCEANNFASLQGDSAGALEALLGLEKQCRLAEDMKLSQETCAAILEVCFGTGDWQSLLDHITVLTKRRGQLKSTIQVRPGEYITDAKDQSCPICVARLV